MSRCGGFPGSRVTVRWSIGIVVLAAGAALAAPLDGPIVTLRLAGDGARFGSVAVDPAGFAQDAQGQAVLRGGCGFNAFEAANAPGPMALDRTLCPLHYAADLFPSTHELTLTAVGRVAGRNGWCPSLFVGWTGDVSCQGLGDCQIGDGGVAVSCTCTAPVGPGDHEIVAHWVADTSGGGCTPAGDGLEATPSTTTTTTTTTTIPGATTTSIASTTTTLPSPAQRLEDAVQRGIGGTLDALGTLQAGGGLGSLLRLTLDAPSAGRTTALLTAAVGARSRVVARGHLRIRQAGAVTVRLRPTAAGRRLLRKTRPLALALSVTFTGGGLDATETGTVTLAP